MSASTPVTPMTRAWNDVSGGDYTGRESSDDEEDDDSDEEFIPPTNRRRISLGPCAPVTRSRAKMIRRLSDHLAPSRTGRSTDLAVRRLGSHNAEP